MNYNNTITPYGVYGYPVQQQYMYNQQITPNYKMDTINFSGIQEQETKKEEKNSTGKILIAIGAVALAGLAIVKHKSIGEFLGIIKKEGTQVADDAGKLAGKQSSNVAEAGTTIAPKVSTAGEKVLTEEAIQTIRKNVQNKITDIEKTSGNPFDDLIKYYDETNQFTDEGTETISTIGTKLLNGYQGKLQETGRISDIAGNLAYIHLNKGNTTEAQKLFTVVAQSSKGLSHKATAYEELAQIAQQAGKSEEAIANYNKSLYHRLEEINSKAAEAKNAKTKGIAMWAKGDLMEMGGELQSFAKRVKESGVELKPLNEAVEAMQSGKSFDEVADKLAIITKNLQA